jgi:hypothetical protein
VDPTVAATAFDTLVDEFTLQQQSSSGVTCGGVDGFLKANDDCDGSVGTVLFPRADHLHP